MEKLPESRVSLDLFPLAPQRDVLGGQLLLQDGHHRRLVLVDGDRLGQGVLEEVVEGVGGDVAGLDGVGDVVEGVALAALVEAAGYIAA